MANEAEKDPDAKFKYEDVDVFKVDIVGGPATKDKFLAVRSEGDEEPSEESIPVVSRREAVGVVIDGKKVAAIITRQVPAGDPNDESDQSLPKEVEEVQQPVELTEDEPETISEEAQMKNLDEGISRLEKVVERMEGVFSGALGLNTASPEGSGKTEPEEKPEGEEVADPESVATPESVPAPEPQKSPETPPVEPVAVAPTPAPIPAPESKEPPQEVPAPATPGVDSAQLETINGSVAGLTAVVERMGKSMESGLTSMKKSIDGISGRVNKVERSVLSGGNSVEDETDGPVERGDGNATGGIWNGVL